MRDDVPYTQKARFYTDKLLLTEQAFVQRSFYTHTHRSFYAQKLSRSMAPEFVGPAPKRKKSADKSPSQPWCSHSNTIHNAQLQKTMVSCTQSQHQRTLTQPLRCDLYRLSCKAPKNYAQQHQKLQLQNQIDLGAKAKTRVITEKMFFLRATKGAKNEKINKMRLPQPQLVKTKLSCETPLQKNNS